MKPNTPKHRLPLLLGTVVLAMSANLALGSGSYTSRPPQPRVGQTSIDRARYSLGQRLFDGKVKLDAQADAAAQDPRLKALQARLPARVGKKKDLPALAGKLSSEQLDALEYYVNQRYRK
jgi:hypothetical protein